MIGNRFVSSVAVVGLLVSGCATTRDSILLGAGVGATTGAVTGYAAGGHSAGPTLLGTVIGAGVGGTIGYLLRKKDVGASSSDKASLKWNDGRPPLGDPMVEVIHIPDTIKGNQYIENHKVWVIKNGSSWRKE